MQNANNPFQPLVKNNRTVILLVFVLMVSGFFGAYAIRSLRVPPVTPAPTDLRLDGKYIWYDLFTSDLKAVQLFYEGLFGWLFHETSSGEGRVLAIRRDDVPIANAVSVGETKMRDGASRWLSYMSVADVDQTVLRIEQHQGAVYMPPKDLPDRGRVAVVKDPEGALFAVLMPLGMTGCASSGYPPTVHYGVNVSYGSYWGRDHRHHHPSLATPSAAASQPS